MRNQSSSGAAVAVGESPPNSYDQVPYKSYPYPQSHPDRLATVATLLGMKPAAVDKCRVLELGCCSGGNLIPMADQLPGSEFVGIDASGRQVGEGQTAVEKLGLANVQLLHKDILEVGPDLGRFDYIIAHGVYSWVPPHVQEKILAICHDNLAPGGVAYVSYNTYPGWHMRGTIRDIMLYRARSCRTPADRVYHARSLVEFLARTVSRDNNPYGMLLKQELDLLLGKDEAYLLHEHLEACNEPLYFHQFIERAEAKGLQYLGEADFGAMPSQNMPEPAEAVLRSVASSLIELEQYADFVRNRMFRQTLLCAAEQVVDRQVAPDRLAGLYVASPVRPDRPIGDPKSDEKVAFRGARAVTTTSDPLFKAALLHLGEIWPRSVAFTELLAIARSRLDGAAAVVAADHLTGGARRLCQPIIRCYAMGQVEFSVRPSAFTLEVEPCAMAPAFARLQAESGTVVTNLRHESLHLSDLQRHLLRHLDGRSDGDALLEALVQRAVAGELIVHEGGQPLRDVDRLRTALAQSVDQNLRQLARRCLLCGR